MDYFFPAHAVRSLLVSGASPSHWSQNVSTPSKPWSEAAKEEGEIACRQAVQKSQAVPGYKPVRVPTLGQRTFAAMVTMTRKPKSASARWITS